MKHDFETIDERIAARSYQLRQLEAIHDALKDATCVAMAGLESIMERQDRGEVELSTNESIALGFAYQALFETADRLGGWEDMSGADGTDPDETGPAGTAPIVF